MTFDLRDSIAVLERTPTVLRGLLADLSEKWTHGNEGPDTWSAFDVVGHLIDGEETDWMVRVMAKQHHEAVGPWEAYLPILHR